MALRKTTSLPTKHKENKFQQNKFTITSSSNSLIEMLKLTYPFGLSLVFCFIADTTKEMDATQEALGLFFTFPDIFGSWSNSQF